MSKKAIVIGAGFSGLASANLLAKNGFEVLVLEKNSSIGGRARRLSEKGFIFDMGPSWYLMPEVFERYFSNFNHKSSDFYSLTKLNPSYTIYLSNGRRLDIDTNLVRTKKLFEELEEGSSLALDRYLSVSKKFYEDAMNKFLYSKDENIASYLTKDKLKSILDMKLHKSFHDHVKSYFKSEIIHKILEYPCVFLGADPRNTPPVYSMLNYVDLVQGVYYPEQGLYSLVSALEKIGKNLGVKYRLSSPVTKILIENSKTIGVRTAGETYLADIVLSSADYPYVDSKLIEEKYSNYTKDYWNNKKISPSGVIFYLGLKTKLKKLEHHNLFINTNWSMDFDYIFKLNKFPENPSFYLSITSKTDRRSSPEGKEAIFVFIPCPSGARDTKSIRDKYFDYVTGKVGQIEKINIKENIIYRKDYAYTNFLEDYNSYKGSALGLSHTLFQTGVFRPKQRNKKIKNLYYTGQYTQPGIGVPMVIISSQNVVDLIKYEQS